VLAQDSLDLSKGPSTKITLFTQRRGFFDVQVVYGERLLASRGYVVLGDKVARSEDCIRYGLTMEHHGSHTRSDGQVPISDVYSLARQMGADTARIFSLAAPQMLSDDGMHYDFSQLDGALALMYSAGLEPFVLLGSDKIGALPGWLRTDKPSVNSVNLVGGTRNAGRKKQLQSLEGGHYLNLDSYADYLHEVFTHLTGRGITYSIWNEPGHKFTVSDIIRIGQITAEVRDVVDTSASIAGYSSSTGPDDKGRRNLRTQPGFLRRVSDVGGLDIIDVLSFHSGHILNYLGPDFDQRNPDTGFVDRLREVIDLDDRGSLPIWDTERGTPWRSRHAGRVDRRLPDEMDDPLHREGDWLEPTRRLPALYASAIAEGVERMYWFSFDASSHAPEELPKRIRAMFDAGWEPMPHVAAYAALTELLGCADYRKTIEAENGDLAWVFSDGELTTVLAYNWQGNDGILQVNRPCKEVGIYDVMGNTLEGDISGTGCSISTGVWMTYVKTRVGNDRTFQAHFAGRGKK